MKKRINIIFSHFDYPKTLSVNDVVNVFKTLPYNEDIGFGYTDVEINSGIVYATLIKRSITTLLEYDLKNKDFIKRKFLFLKKFLSVWILKSCFYIHMV